MKLRKLVLDNGQVVEVEEARFLAFDALRTDVSKIVGAAPIGMDANEGMAFLVSQLAYTESQVFEKLYIPMQYEELLAGCISFEAGEYVDQIRYEMYDHAGRGRKTSGKGKDIPKVDVTVGEKTMDVALGSIGYDYTQEELRRSAFLRRPLNARRLEAAMEGYRRHMNDVGLFGEAESNFTGLFNNANVPTGNAPTGAWATGPKSAALILTDLNTLILNVWNNTAYNDLPDTIAIAPSAFAYISTTPRSDNSDKTILQFLLENNLAKTMKNIALKIIPGYGLDTAGASGTKRMIAYVKNSQRVVMHVPMPLRFLSPQLVGLSVEIPGEYKYSGVEVRYPKSMYYMDGL